jgi:hypothetical protein
MKGVEGLEGIKVYSVQRTGQQDAQLPQSPSGLEGIKVYSVQPNKDSSLGQKPASTVKSLAAGVLGGIPDTAALLYNIPAAVHNMNVQNRNAAGEDLKELYQELGRFDPKYLNYDQEMPLIPSAQEGIDQGIDRITGGYTKTPESMKHFNEGAKLVGNLASFGGLAKGAEKIGRFGVSKLAGALGTTKPLPLTGAAVTGSTLSKLDEEGVSPFVSLPASIAAGTAATSIPKAISRVKPGSKNLLVNFMGLSPKNLNLEAARAAAESGIDLPAAALTDSKITSLADQFVGKTPHFGDKLKNKYLTAEKQMIGELEKAYDAVGPVNTEEVANQIFNLYDKSATLLPKEAQIIPKHTLNTIENVLSKIKTASPSSAEKELLNELTALKDNLAPNGIRNIPTPVELLIGTKKSLNSTIRWNQDEGVKNLLRKVQTSLLNDIGEYGKINKGWHQYFEDADALFGKVARRERLEQLLSGKGINQATGNLSYNALSKVINTPQTAKEIERIAGKETFAKIQKLGTVAKAMALKNKNIPNPSGTAVTAAVGGLLTGIYTAPIPTIAAVIGTGGLTKLLTDQKFLDLAIKAAEQKGKTNLLSTMALNRRVKELTGYAPITLNKMILNQEIEE